ncbi:hypothetical protein RvY_06756 [Ramazzottius varieornatus]|uniref:Uncharacterized protein n=1 Tax=Ramazzottius varieornatus TaxID=947166 RepID=A0A1D1V982_RAMVA|nr:hypothetical protein RvY_06756 [Ramazzottius varieornatus]
MPKNIGSRYMAVTSVELPMNTSIQSFTSGSSDVDIYEYYTKLELIRCFLH